MSNENDHTLKHPKYEFIVYNDSTSIIHIEIIWKDNHNDGG
jgi:hypothetical protein